MAEEQPQTDLTNAIAESAAGPASSTLDGEHSQEHSLPDQIAADRYLASKKAAKSSPNFGLRFMKIVPPGA